MHPGTAYDAGGASFSATDFEHNAVNFIDVHVENNKNRALMDFRNERAYASRLVIETWKVGDIVEFGYQNETVTKTELVNNSDLRDTKKDGNNIIDIDYMDPEAKENMYAPRLDYPFQTGAGVPIQSYEYFDAAELYSNNQFDPDFKLLNNGVKNTLDINKSQLIYMAQGTKDEDNRTSIIADLGSAKTTNVYTAYLNGDIWGVDPNATNMEVYGSNDKANWERLAGASYNQLLLHKGAGFSTIDDDNDKGTISLGQTSSGQVKVRDNSPSFSILNDDDVASGYNNTVPGDDNSRFESGGKVLLVGNFDRDSASAYFDLVVSYDTVRSINQIDLSYYMIVNRVIGLPKRNVEVFASNTGTDDSWANLGTFSNTPVGFTWPVFDEMTDIYQKNSNNNKWEVKNEHKTSHVYRSQINLGGDTYTAKYFKVRFHFESYPGGYTYEKDGSSNATKTWHYIGFTEIDFTHTLDGSAYGKRKPLANDSYTLTAISEKQVNYRYLKYTFIQMSDVEPNCFIIDEIEARNSNYVRDMPKQTILHLNTKQMTSGNHMIANSKDTYLGRFNTLGEVCADDVFAETVLVPGYNYNAIFDTGFYTEFSIERVKTAELNQPDKPDDTPNTSLDWDGRNANVLKKLEHIAPDRVVVDGNLNDTGWDGTWTEVDGSKNATNLDGNGTDFKYQLRADGEYLYAAAIIDSAYDASNAPKFGIWLKGNDGIAYYSVGYGSTTIDFAKPEPTAEYGAIDTLSIATKNGATYDEANEKLTFAYDLVAKKNDENIADSYLFGYTDEIMESTSDGIWVWEGRPQTQSFTLANETAMMSASGNTVVTGLNNIGEGKTLVEFKVKLDEFGGKDGFEYFVEATSNNGSTIYPYVRTADKHPENNWDSNEAIKVTAEDMTGWGDYRMVEDYAPVTSLGAKVNPSYNGKKTIRFGARYTEEFIRRQNVVDGTDYWMVADVGIIILPTHILGDEELTLNTSNTAGASAQDIVNWQNVPDEGTNFADYESFVFYVNLVGVEGIENMPLTFRSYVDYYNADNGSETYYSIPLERSYDGVYNTANENAVLPN
ncbi:MAG: hypothetical protein IJC20_01290 [Clostridia bacterium]|nr:hypothetical protein [Clostridia bacterium]